MTGRIFTSGALYSLFNGEFGTVMEFYPSSGLVQAGRFDGGRCQQWEFIPADEGFIVRCVGGAKDGSAAYLNFEGGSCSGEKLRASSRPMVWHIARDGDMIRGAGFAMQSGTVTGDGQPLYLTIEGPAVADAAIVAKPYPVSWDVRRYETDATARVGYR
ncbi:hypothetical protein TRAPUB_469 [Trametes pubescens]|uniref:Ricin B lectin domain-containing protein n=1 Tax=Trametes pubescens TaxID=154538 RepID=A0A1M2VM41_TRAPU|nr:hypothetical protein TRAPUB_469 [Trametes pubescens]